MSECVCVCVLCKWCVHVCVCVHVCMVWGKIKAPHDKLGEHYGQSV